MFERLLNDLISKIDSYDIEVQEEGHNRKDEQGNDIIESAKESHERVQALLGENGVNKLYEETVDNNPTTAREAFIKHLVNILADNKNNFSTKDFSAKGIIANSPNDPRKIDPESHTITLEKLLGTEGVDLYKKAVKEERASKAFRDAVFLKSTNHYEGPKWKERMILWVAGPSASGKSFSADFVVKKIGSDYMDVIPENYSGNTVVSIDGGVERKVSQMRQLVFQVALQKGYPGISDLHDNTKLKLKSIVEKAALENQNINLVIPETFADLLDPYKPEKFDALENTRQIFSEVVAPKNKDNQFRETVYRLGNSRAWNDDFSNQNTKDRKISMNNRDIKWESKKYIDHFTAGKFGSQQARKKYIAESKYKIYVPIPNDLIYIRLKDQNKNEWIRCSKEYKGEAILISERDFEKWKKHKKNNYITEGFEALDHINNLSDWIKIRKKFNKLSLPETPIQNLQAQRSLHAALKTELKTLKMRLTNIKKSGGDFVNPNETIKQHPVYFLWHYPDKKIKAQKKSNQFSIWQDISAESIASLLYSDALLGPLNQALGLEKIFTHIPRNRLDILPAVPKFIGVLDKTKKFIEAKRQVNPDNNLLNALNKVLNLYLYLKEIDLEQASNDENLLLACDLTYDVISKIYIDFPELRQDLLN
ncbi:MAG TPA: hypothetical protein VHA13_01565, partial [Gammaproteobacteria bacterium]|nr:hypothetical protein [Gammaproteobacteria bacterium]